MIDEGLLSIISAGCGQLVKMLITLGSRGIFGSNFPYLFIRGFAEHHFGQSMSFSKNAHTSCTTPYILIKFSILIHFNTVETLVYKTVNFIVVNQNICYGYSKDLYILTVLRYWYTKR